MQRKKLVLNQDQPMAVALRYDPAKDNAPKIVAQGQGYVAEKICEVAKEHAVPVYSQPELAGALMQQQLGAEIPPELYTMVAEVLTFIYRLNVAHGPPGFRDITTSFISEEEKVRR